MGSLIYHLTFKTHLFCSTDLKMHQRTQLLKKTQTDVVQTCSLSVSNIFLKEGWVWTPLASFPQSPLLIARQALHYLPVLAVTELKNGSWPLGTFPAKMSCGAFFSNTHVFFHLASFFVLFPISISPSGKLARGLAFKVCHSFWRQNSVGFVPLLLFILTLTIRTWFSVLLCSLVYC